MSEKYKSGDDQYVATTRRLHPRRKHIKERNTAKEMLDIKGKCDALLRLSVFLILWSHRRSSGTSLNLLSNNVPAVSRLQSP